MLRPTINVAENGDLHIHIPMQIRRIQGRKNIIPPNALDGEIPDAPDPTQPALIQALARAFTWAELIESGQVNSIAALARSVDVDGTYVARILKQTTPGPDIIQAILNGEESRMSRMSR